MAGLRFWERRWKEYDCCGKIRRVYTDFNEIFPLYIPDYQSKTSASLDAAKQIEAKVSHEHKEVAKNLLVRIASSNRNQQQNLRSAYAIYASAPCEALETFISEVKATRELEARLAKVDLWMHHISNILSRPSATKSLNSSEDVIGKLLMRAMDTLHEETYLPKVVDALSVVSKNTTEWRS